MDYLIQGQIRFVWVPWAPHTRGNKSKPDNTILGVLGGLKNSRFAPPHLDDDDEHISVDDFYCSISVALLGCYGKTVESESEEPI